MTSLVRRQATTGLVAFAAVVACLGPARTAAAQSRQTPAPSRPPAIGVRGFGDIGSTQFSADRSFKAVLGSSAGLVFGLGGEVVVVRPRIVVGLRVSRFKKAGERVAVVADDVFKLGIPATVSVTPIQVVGGYRVHPARSRLLPYVGGGIGWYRYAETSEFADEDGNVKETFMGYLVLGGVEFRAGRWIGLAGEAEWATVPDALGRHPTGASAAFGETDLGGATFRVKLLVGR